MDRQAFLFLCILLTSCSSTRYYVVRHTEKEAAVTMTSDVPLSEEGSNRALALREALKKKNIRAIFSTRTLRTEATARPLSEQVGVPIQTYETRDTGFIARLLQQPKGDVLLVGHSNTVDDLVNGLAGRTLLQDLPETEYGDLFLVKKRKGKTSFHRKHFGK